MAKFLVLRRMDLGTVYGAGAIVEDPPDIQLLIDRHYITPVPDDYVTPTYNEEPAKTEPATDSAPTPAAEAPANGEGADQSSNDDDKPDLPKTIDLSGVEAAPATPAETPAVEATGA